MGKNKTFTASFHFDMNDPQSKMEHARMCKATDMALFIWELANTLSDDLEYQKIPNKTINKICDLIQLKLSQRGIDIDNLIE